MADELFPRVHNEINLESVHFYIFPKALNQQVENKQDIQLTHTLKLLPFQPHIDDSSVNMDSAPFEFLEVILCAQARETSSFPKEFHWKVQDTLLFLLASVFQILAKF